MINYLRNLFGFSLKSKIIKALESKINEAEKEFNLEMDSFIKDHKQEVKDTISEMMIKLDNLKSNKKIIIKNIESDYINKIISKIL